MNMALVFLRRHNVEAAATQVGRKHCGIFERLIGKQRLRLALIEAGRRGGDLGGRAQEARGRHTVVKHKLRRWEGR